MQIKPFFVLDKLLPKSSKRIIFRLKDLYFTAVIIIGAMMVLKADRTCFIRKPVQTATALFGADIEIKFSLHQAVKK